ncbi:MAG TPA: hypothetical protein VHX42_00100 [Candidatus Babeliales bacterium]|jgi:hypothetical protein|nr:hypothetical protein [Candidatus Babeliales bacterium]
MTKKFLLIASFSTALMHGMEPIEAIETVSLLEMTKTSLSLLYNGTKINLIKGSWEDATDTMELTIVGNQQQHMLQEGEGNLSTIGRTYWSSGTDGCIRERKKDDESASDDDIYKPHRQIDTQTWRDPRKKTKSFIIKIEEPCISDSTRIKRYGFADDSGEIHDITIPAQCQNTFVYNVQRPVPGREQDMYYDLCFKGDQAITEASNDLSLCYTNALIEGSEYFKFRSSKKDKNIAFPTLGADVGFPRDKAVPIAIQAVFDFLQDHLNQYESVNLFVKKRSEFALYKKLLLEYYKPINAICLFIWSHKNNTVFSSLPWDIIPLIVRLMYNS